MNQDDLKNMILAHAQSWIAGIPHVQPPEPPPAGSGIQLHRQHVAAMQAHNLMLADHAARRAPARGELVLGRRLTPSEAVAFSAALSEGEADGLWRVEVSGRERAVVLLGVEAKR